MNKSKAEAQVDALVSALKIAVNALVAISDATVGVDPQSLAKYALANVRAELTKGGAA